MSPYAAHVDIYANKMKASIDDRQLFVFAPRQLINEISAAFHFV